MRASLLDPHSATWSGEIDHIGAILHAGSNPTLFPYHFLQVVLPKLGGHIAWFFEERARIGVGFLFPRGLTVEADRPAARTYTLRYHALTPPSPSVSEAATAALAPLLGGASVVFYDPDTAHTFYADETLINGISIGRPSAVEAAQVPELHRRIWGSPLEFLYPADIHSVEFGLGTSLIARVEGQVVAFLFGFTKFGGPALPADWHARFRGDLRLESQTMGVLPEYRGLRIGNVLKRSQAEHALAAGISIIHWTADPLQFPNAALNFGLLRGLAFHHYPDFYPFRNDLNRAPASRFALTWLATTERVRNVPLIGSRSLILDLRRRPEIVRVNDSLRVLTLDADAPYLAVEIPADWTGLQQRSVEEALQWRAVTDELFQHYVGTADGQYVITGVGTDQDRRYLIGERAGAALWEHLGHVAPDDTPPDAPPDDALEPDVETRR
jgi:predicted GNAT superfamily acetyltransferase